MEKMEGKIDRKKILYKGYRKIYYFTRDETIHAYWDYIKNGGITMDKPNNEQKNLAQKIREFKSNTKPKNPSIIKEKSDVKNDGMAHLKGKEMVYNNFQGKIFSLPNQSIVLAEPQKSSSSKN